MQTSLPTGTVTFLFTDIEGSTRLRQSQPAAYQRSLALHNDALAQAIERHNGFTFKVIGDAFCAAFHTAPDALQAALDAQLTLDSADWDVAPIRVRMALHTGAAELRDGDYWGFTLARVARLVPAGHGGQVLLSQAVADLVIYDLPAGAVLRDLGERRLKDLLRPEHVYQLVAPGLADQFPPLKTLDLHPHNLPVQLTSFIGRETEITDVKRLLASARLLTLIGPGGTGKSRLSLQVASDVLSDYAHGVWLVELAPIADDSLVLQAVASIFGLRDEPGRPMSQALADYLRAKSLLLVLDNCEHLINACARLVDELLRAAPGIRLLATSREGLGIAGEVTYQVQSLQLPDLHALPTVTNLTQFEAVRLFIDRAMSVDPAFAVTNANAPAVAQICHRLDGIPLAIELAAARTRHLRLEELAARLNDRLGILTGGSRTALPRQQTLRATIDWSYDLLTPAERLLLRRLSVFPGGAVLEAAEQVCSGGEVEAGQALDLLSALVNKSLLRLDDRPDIGSTRYMMLETVRQYAREKLQADGEEQALQDRHLAYYEALADEAEPYFWRSEQLVWLARFGAEHDNLRAALDYALAARPSSAVHITAQVWMFWSLRNHYTEAIEWLDRSLKAVRTMPPDQWIALSAVALAFFTWMQHGQREAEPLMEQAHDIARRAEDEWSLAASHLILAQFIRNYGRVAEAEAHMQVGLTLCEQIGNVWGQAWANLILGGSAMTRGDIATASAHAERALALHVVTGERVGLADSLALMADLARAAGDYERATHLVQQQLTVARELGDRDNVGSALSGLGYLLYLRGDYQPARELLEEGLLTIRDAGNDSSAIGCLLHLGIVASLQGRAVDSGEHLAEAVALAQALDTERIWAKTHFYAGLSAYYRGSLEQSAQLLGRNLTRIRESGYEGDLGSNCYALGQTLFCLGETEQASQLVEEGLAVSRGIAERSLALLLGLRGRMALARGDLERAADDLHESLEIRTRQGAKRDVAEAIEWMAQLAAQTHNPQRAARLVGAAEALREQIGAPLPPVERPEYDRTVALIDSQLDASKQQAAWDEGRAMTWEQAAAFALERPS